MNLYEEFGADASLEKNGTWYYLDDEQQVGFLLARAGGTNKAYQKALDRRLKVGKRSALKPEKIREASFEAFIEACVLDWKGVKDKDGNALSCTKENVRKVLKDLPDLYDELAAAAQDADTFRAELQEEEAGNS